ncbi:PepSY domain-containing protein [Stenotrophomonas sp. WHRI 8082]|uniref:PepSY domain-containing protein n=1 Tax=Stenotrophomonas sp. WHRI 8082 TaxID=3162571 RepID=UPI0032EFD4D1
MFKNVLFQVHWFLGITAGTVLALMGLTGATLSFEDELLRALNPGFAAVATQHADGQQALPLSTLVDTLGASSDTPLQRLRVDATGQRPSVARFEGGRDNWVYFDPYTGESFSALRGQAFFDFMEDLHRRLVAGERGQLVTGICTIFLLVFVLSGIYLRWPRQWWNWRSWFAVEWKHRGRSFLWSLHSVIGTWVLPVYLLIVLTGLWWSFDWYRDGLTRVLGGERETPAVLQGEGTLNLQRVQATLYALPGVREGYIDLRLPARGDRPLTVRVMSATSTHHDRAHDVLQLDPSSGALLEQRAYGSLDAGGKVLTSMFALHSGSFFGLPGRLIVMLSSLMMVLFFVTGWMLYLDRRAKKRAVRASRVDLPALDVTGDAGGPAWLVSFASQSGQAEQLAWRAAGQLQAAGMRVQVQPLARLDVATLQQTERALFVVSTFGDGEAPDSARVFERKVLAQAQALPGLGYAMLALGDRQYARFCGFARRVETWLGEQGAAALFPCVEVDGDDARALQRWQQHLVALTGIEALEADASPSALQEWSLVERVLLNPGSQGGAIWQITLQPPPGTGWQAGDILQVAPREGDAHVQAVLHAAGVDADAWVHVDGATVRVDDAAALRVLPDATQVQAVHDAVHWLDELPRLPPREYSIASCAADGTVQLVVRLVYDAAGRAGLGSGWLAHHAPVAGPVHARVRRNAGFHRHADAPPMILIGNGTGIAGLRSLLREAHAAGHHGHWLLFGERQQACDALYADELRDWQAQRHLSRVDLAWSRDGETRLYVQDLLRAASAELRHWIADGACLYVCGSLQGMAQGVDDVLRETLGEDALDALLAEGRYRRDVY